MPRTSYIGALLAANFLKTDNNQNMEDWKMGTLRKLGANDALRLTKVNAGRRDIFWLRQELKESQCLSVNQTL